VYAQAGKNQERQGLFGSGILVPEKCSRVMKVDDIVMKVNGISKPFIQLFELENAFKLQQFFSCCVELVVDPAGSRKTLKWICE
jgi:hypothetical protein